MIRRTFLAALAALPAALLAKSSPPPADAWGELATNLSRFVPDGHKGEIVAALEAARAEGLNPETFRCASWMGGLRRRPLRLTFGSWPGGDLATAEAGRVLRFNPEGPAERWGVSAPPHA